MGNEELEAVKKALAAMKKIELTGFTNTETATAYFKEKEMILEGIVKTMETITVQESSEMEALKATVKSLRDELKGRAANPRELTRKELQYRLGKALAAAWTGNHGALAELSFTPNLKADNWTNPRDVSWGEKGWNVNEKAALGSPMGNLSTNDQYLINPIYETEIMQDAAKKSVMMPLVRHRPMMGPSIFLPTRDRGGVQLHWLTAYGQQITGSKPQGAQRVELKAYTLAGYIPWYDEFEEDVFIDLGAMFIDEFTEVYGQEFDRQCLLADDDPFTGAMAVDGAEEVEIAGADINGLTWKDFRDAVYRVPAEERKDCAWFLHETVLNHIANIEDADGRPIWRRPTEAMPGKLDLYPYHEVSIMPQIGAVENDTPFAIFMNPKRIQHGNRKGIEIKKFDGTTESMEYGELFLRFRKRDGFLVTRPSGNMVILKTKP
ncbi:phage major capsid protein [Leadbettera azotonutricia]|uniref:Phage major capsid protein, HK97 family n=1 Tax=Leadbettera azotonutricia (strain ATCC BAA-888 / DSM 13862 / ZAS-9) TaxID=545695 RepID=F5Y7L2_LEAAZ|nr:phage major capsid protein [Leadbettera azotonutricia]AEF82118.1 phage major capsid protein, HK97 family [Leadbettera azotonutricia ZAS-9]